MKPQVTFVLVVLLGFAIVSSGCDQPTQQLETGKVVIRDVTLQFLRQLERSSIAATAVESGRAFAREDIASGINRILYYGEPWSDGKPLIDEETGYPVTVTSGCIVTKDFTLLVNEYNLAMREHFRSARPAKGKWPQVRQSGEWSEGFLAHSKTVAESRGTPTAKPEDLIAWGNDEQGLRTGLLMAPRVTLGGQLPTRIVLRNVSNEVQELGLSISLNRLDAFAKTPNGRLLDVYKVVLFGNDPSYQVTLKPGEQVEFEGPPVEFGVERDVLTKMAKTPNFPVCGVDTGVGKVLVYFSVKAKTGEAVVEVVSGRADKKDEKPPWADNASVPGDAARAAGQIALWRDGHPISLTPGTKLTTILGTKAECRETPGQCVRPGSVAGRDVVLGVGV